VRIGSTIPIASSFVAAVIDRVSRQYPRISFQVVAIQTETLHRELLERNVDFLIARRFGPEIDERLHFETLCNDPYVVTAGLQNPLLKRRKLRLSDLVNEAWALPPPDSLVGSFVTKAFRASGLEFPTATVVTFPFCGAYDARGGRSVSNRSASILADASCKTLVYQAIARRVAVGSGPIGIFTVETRSLSSAAQMFIEHAREIAKA